MNIVILTTWSFEEIFTVFHIYEYILANTCRMDFIQSALDGGVPQVSNTRFPDNFGSFLTSTSNFEVGRLVKKRRNFDLNLSFIHVTF